MRKTKKNDSLEDYMKRGGLRGIAEQYLKDEMEKATTEKKHPLRVVFEACQKKGH